MIIFIVDFKDMKAVMLQRCLTKLKNVGSDQNAQNTVYKNSEASQNQNHGKPSLFQWLFLSMWYETLLTHNVENYIFAYFFDGYSVPQWRTL